MLKVELSTLGGFKTLPYLVMFAMSNVGGWAGDYLILRQKYSVGAARKTVNTMGGWAPWGSCGPGCGVLLPWPPFFTAAATSHAYPNLNRCDT